MNKRRMIRESRDFCPCLLFTRVEGYFVFFLYIFLYLPDKFPVGWKMYQ